MEGLGKYILFIGQLFTKRERFKTYLQLILDECIKIGIDSIFIIAIVSTFIGAVTTLQTAYNLVSPLIPKYTISLVLRDMTILELSPTIMCVVLAGKVGSNIAGELGTMRISEQIDALEVMGINSISYLVLPKLIAALITIPMLVVLSAFLSFAGGFAIGMFGDLMTQEEFVRGLRSDFISFNVPFALIKAFVFAFLIVTISSYKGFYTKGGALEVGQASTSAVTSSCIAVLCADYLLAEMILR